MKNTKHWILFTLFVGLLQACGSTPQGDQDEKESTDPTLENVGPAAITLNCTSDYEIVVSWDPIQTLATEFQIEKKTDYTDFALLGTALPTDLSFTTDEVNTIWTHTVRVRGYNATDGHTDYSAEQSIKLSADTCNYVPTKENLDYVYLFATTWGYSGNLNGREGADEICMNNLPISIDNYNVQVHALVSFSSSDDIEDMAANYNIPTTRKISGKPPTSIGSDTREVASSWANFVDGDINQTLEDADILDLPYFWSGSNYKGQYAGDSYACEGFTSDSSLDDGRLGRNDKKDLFLVAGLGAGWLYYGDEGDCNDQYKILCVMY